MRVEAPAFGSVRDRVHPQRCGLPWQSCRLSDATDATTSRVAALTPDLRQGRSRRDQSYRSTSSAAQMFIWGCGTMCAMPNTDPESAWKALQEGNQRFVAGKPQHPSQSFEHRASLAAAQKPTAVIFGCADSRVAAEVIFDQGLGDVFVVRTVGHVIGSAVLGSIEYAVTVLNVPLVVVLGHDNCGAVSAALTALDERILRLRARCGGTGCAIDPAGPT